MRYKIVYELSELDSIDFIPTVCIVFYQFDDEASLLAHTEKLNNLYNDIDIIGSSSYGNIYNELPHVDPDNTHPFVFVFFDIKKEAYSIETIKNKKKISCFTSQPNSDKNYKAILFSTINQNITSILSALKEQIGEKNLFGTLAGTNNSQRSTTGTLFWNGELYNDLSLVWIIDQDYYELKGVCTHIFEPVGFSLNITNSEKNTIYEIENEPALEILESIMGTLSDEGIESFDYPFFISDDSPITINNIPLSSLRSIDRVKKSLTFYNSMANAKKIRIATPVIKRKQEMRILNLAKVTKENAFVFLFFCVGFRKYWNGIEQIYLIHLANNMKNDFIGLHTNGEIGPLDTDQPSYLQNQTMMLVSLSEKVES